MRILLRLLSYLKPYWRMVALGLGSVLLWAILNAVLPLVIRNVIDNGLGSGDTGVLLVSAAIILGAGLVRSVFAFGRAYIPEYLGTRIAYDLRNRMYDHLQHQSFAYHDRSQTGELMARVTSDVDMAYRFVAFGLQQGVTFLLTFGVVLVSMFVLNAELALVTLAVLPFMLGRAVWYGRRARPLSRRVQEQFATLGATLQESLAGVRVVKAFAAEERETAHYERDNREFYRRNLTLLRAWSFNQPFMVFMTGLGTALILIYGGFKVINGQMSVGTIVAFNTYLLLLAVPARTLGMIASVMARSIASGERIFAVLDSVPEIADAPDAVVLTDVAGHVVFETVSFGYSAFAPGATHSTPAAQTVDDSALTLNDDAADVADDAAADAARLGKVTLAVLDDISFTARPGQVIALVGATGSGKSSIISLIPRFYDVTGGRILVDGHDVRSVSLDSLRRHVGSVLQDTFLFSDTIRANIAYGRPDATDEQVDAAARAARAHDFISAFPDGYATEIGERGVTLSGGQRQRLAIARALLLDPRILILDDSTSSVDTETEYMIQQALAVLMQGRTTFVIAQRLTTVKNADMILVLENGRVVERGTHDALLAQGGRYAAIYAVQLKDQDDVYAQGKREEVAA